jgi:hypothetical protein
MGRLRGQRAVGHHDDPPLDDTLTIFHTHAVFELLVTLHPSALSTHTSHEPVAELQCQIRVDQRKNLEWITTVLHSAATVSTP